MSSAQRALAATAGGFAKVEKGETLIEVKNLKMHFPVVEGIVFQKAIAHVKAVDDITFSINADGSERRQLTDMTSAFIPNVSPDRTQVVFFNTDTGRITSFQPMCSRIRKSSRLT